MNKEEMEMYNMMVELGVATAEELNLARDLLVGSWKSILNEVLYARTGNTSWEQYLEELAEEE